jgi:hypothetical protein
VDQADQLRFREHAVAVQNAGRRLGALGRVSDDARQATVAQRRIKITCRRADLAQGAQGADDRFDLVVGTRRDVAEQPARALVGGGYQPR